VALKTYWRIPLSPVAKQGDSEIPYLQGSADASTRFHVEVKLPIGVINISITESQYRVLCAEIKRGVDEAVIFEEPSVIEEEPPTNPHRKSLPPEG
jgi:hypothetical protein